MKTILQHRTLPILLLAAILLLFSCAESKTINVRLTCEPCTISCSSSRCYRIRAGSYDQQYCDTNGCSVSMDMNMTVGPCSASMTGGSCTTGLCYSSTTMDICSSYYSAYSSYSCGSSYWVYETCGSCTSTQSCSTCLQVSSSYYSTPTEVCFSPGCSAFTSLNATFRTCSSGLDWTGNSCNCCFHISTTGGSAFTGMCTDTNNALGSSGFTSYAKTQTSSEGIGNFGLLLLIAVLLSLLTLWSMQPIIYPYQFYKFIINQQREEIKY